MHPNFLFYLAAMHIFQTDFTGGYLQEYRKYGMVYIFTCWYSL